MKVKLLGCKERREREQADALQLRAGAGVHTKAAL
jgi:hypothetical protein